MEVKKCHIRCEVQHFWFHFVEQYLTDHRNILGRMQGRRKQELKLIAVWLNLKTDSHIFAFAYRFLRYSSQTLKQHGTYSAQTQNTFYLKLKAFNSINSQLRGISSCVLSRIIQCIIPVAVLSTTGGAAVGDGGGLDPGAV